MAGPSPRCEIRPDSAAAAIVATASLGGATLLRIAVGWLGVSAPFGTFFPAVLVTALLAGVPAAVGVIAVSVLIAWVDVSTADAHV